MDHCRLTSEATGVIAAMTFGLGTIFGATVIGTTDPEPVEPVIQEVKVFVVDSALYWAGRYSIDVELARDIMNLAKRYGFDPALIFSVIETESSFRPRAQSAVGAIGLMQVLPSTARIYSPELTTEELFNVTTNLNMGLSYLRDMRHEFGDIRSALVAYNAGPGRARRIIDKHGTDVQYVRSVLGK